MNLLTIFNLSMASIYFWVVFISFILGIYWSIKKARINFIAWAWSMTFIYTLLFFSNHPNLSDGIIHKVLSIEFNNQTDNFLLILSFLITGVFIFRLSCATYYFANKLKRNDDLKRSSLKTIVKETTQKTILYSHAIFMAISDGKNHINKQDKFCEKLGIFKHIL